MTILPLQVIGLVDSAGAGSASSSAGGVPAAARLLAATGPTPVALSPTSVPSPVTAPAVATPAVTTPAVRAAAPAPVTPPPETLEDRTSRSFSVAVPERWRSAIPIHFEIGEGWTSWAYPGGRIIIGRRHAQARSELLVDVIAHEFGHQIAFRHGSGAYLGAPPTGWPSPDHHPAEAWADCVQTVFTGRSNPSHGLPACGGDRLAWAAEWLTTIPG